MMALGALKGFPVVGGFLNVTFRLHIYISQILMQFEEDRFIIFPEKWDTDGQKDRQTDTQINGGQNNTCLFGCVMKYNIVLRPEVSCVFTCQMWAQIGLF